MSSTLFLFLAYNQITQFKSFDKLLNPFLKIIVLCKLFNLSKDSNPLRDVASFSRSKINFKQFAILGL